MTEVQPPQAQATSVEFVRARFDASYRWPVVRVLLAPVIWRLPTHPPLDERVARLEALGAQRGVA